MPTRAQKNRKELSFHAPSSEVENITKRPRNEDVKLYREWDTPTRVRVKTLFETGHTRAFIFSKTQVPIRTQRLWTTRPYRRTGKNRVGRPKIIDKYTLRRMIRYVSKSFENRQSTWRQLASDFTDGASARTVQNAMENVGYRKCKACQKTWLTSDNVAGRKAFCKEYRKRAPHWWRRVRFTDEVHFAIESRGAAWVIRNEDERFCGTCIQYRKRSRGSQLHCWAMVGYNYKSPEIVFFDSNDCSEESSWIYEAIGTQDQPLEPARETEEEERQLLGDGKPSTCKHRCKNKEACKHSCCKAGYRGLKAAGNLTQVQYLNKIFKPHIENAWQEAKDRHHPFVLLEDNDGSHGTRSTSNIVARYKATLEERGFQWYANAPKSPDFNIIENVWRILKQRVKRHQCTTKDQLIEAIKSEWQKIEQEKINALIDGMPERIEEGYRREGLHTPW